MKIGIVLDPNENDLTGEILSYTEMKEAALAAEANGFDSIWLFDHLLFRFEGQPTRGTREAWTTLSALAEATERVELGTLVLCNPFRNPALLAKMAHTLDHISNGRVLLGLGAGWHKPEFDAFGFPFERRVDRFEEALQIVAPLLRVGHVDFAGEFYTVEDCVIKPKGPRENGIPLLIGAGKPRMLRLVARYADQWNTVWLGQPEELAERMERIHTACAEVGRDPESLTITVGVQVSFPDLGESRKIAQNPLTGDVEQLAKAFADFERGGAQHLILYITPVTNERVIERVAQSVELYRNGAV